MQYMEEKIQAQALSWQQEVLHKAKSSTIHNTIYFPDALVNLLLPFSSI